MGPHPDLLGACSIRHDTRLLTLYVVCPPILERFYCLVSSALPFDELLFASTHTRETFVDACQLPLSRSFKDEVYYGSLVLLMEVPISAPSLLIHSSCFSFSAELSPPQHPTSQFMYYWGKRHMLQMRPLMCSTRCWVSKGRRESCISEHSWCNLALRRAFTLGSHPACPRALGVLFALEGAALSCTRSAKQNRHTTGREKRRTSNGENKLGDSWEINHHCTGSVSSGVHRNNSCSRHDGRSEGIGALVKHGMTRAPRLRMSKYENQKTVPCLALRSSTTVAPSPHLLRLMGCLACCQRPSPRQGMSTETSGVFSPPYRDVWTWACNIRKGV